MTTIVITKDDTGRLGGLGEKDKKAYSRFRKIIDALGDGEILTLDYWFPRNRKLLGLHFVMLSKLKDAQEQFEDLDTLRYWLTVGAGDADFYPGPTGRMVAIPRSINFRTMDDIQFSEHHERVKAFMRSDRCQSFLWPHLLPVAASEMVEAVLREFEK